MKEVLSLRTLHKQLSQLLSLSEQDEMKMSKSFEPFDKSIPTQYSPYTEPLWRAAVSQFENSLAPAGKYLKIRSEANPVKFNMYLLFIHLFNINMLFYFDILERRIAGKLRSQLRNMHGNTLQLLQEFKRYQESIKRPSIQRELVAERESLLGKNFLNSCFITD